MNKKLWAAMFVLGLLALLAGCSKKENTNEEQTTSPSSEMKPSATATPIDPATAASVSGTVTFGGAAPKAAKIDMSQDAACKGNNVAETIVANAPSTSPKIRSPLTRRAAAITRTYWA
jgi:hypothetical protein